MAYFYFHLTSYVCTQILIKLKEAQGRFNYTNYMKMLLFYVCIYWYISCLRALQTSSSSRCKQLKKIADFYFFHRLSLSFSIWINAKCVSVIRRWHCSDIKAICQNAQKSVCVFVTWAKQFPAKRRKVLIRKTVFISLTSHIIDATLNLKCWHCNIIPLRYWDFSASSPPPRTLTWSLAIWRKKEKKLMWLNVKISWLRKVT